MRQGHTARLGYDTILTKFGPYVSNSASVYKQDFCRDILLTIGCNYDALIMGRSQIFFRPKNERFVEKLLGLDDEEAKRVAEAASHQFYNRQKRVLRIRFKFLNTRKLFFCIFQIKIKFTSVIDVNIQKLPFWQFFLNLYSTEQQEKTGKTARKSCKQRRSACKKQSGTMWWVWTPRGKWENNSKTVNNALRKQRKFEFKQHIATTTAIGYGTSSKKSDKSTRAHRKEAMSLCAIWRQEWPRQNKEW